MSTATITWTLPTTRVDGSALAPTDILGIQILDAVNGAPAAQIGEPSGAVTSFTTPTLAGGTHVFTLIVIDTSGTVSAASTPVSLNIVLPAPNPVTNVTVTRNS